MRSEQEILHEVGNLTYERWAAFERGDYEQADKYQALADALKWAVFENVQPISVNAANKGE